MTMYEISLLLPDPDDQGVRRIRVTDRYIAEEASLSAEQKAAIRALPPGGVWSGNVIEVKRLMEH
jgi:hypothetical protein